MPMKKIINSLQITRRGLAVALTVNPRLRMALVLTALFTVNTLSAFAQSTTFNSTDIGHVFQCTPKRAGRKATSRSFRA